MRFDAGLSANNSSATQRTFAQAVPQEPAYSDPNALQPEYLDDTATGSINRQAVRNPSLLAGPARRAGPAIPVPRANVGSTTAAAQVQPQYRQQTAATQPFPAAARQPYPNVANQAFPGDVQKAPSQVTRQQVAALPAANTASGGIDRTVTGSIQKPSIAPSDAQEGWSRTGGTQIKVREGETVYNLSRRFGVPAKAIMRANGLSDSSALQAGQSIIIPTYVYSSTAPNSMPDNNPNVADAKSSRGTKFDVQPGKVPLPNKAPTERLAVLPQPTREAERQNKPSDANAARTATTGAVYSVVAGDTLSGIAAKTGSSTNAIKQANKLDSGLIQIGQKLVIPGATVGANVASALPAGVDPMVTGSVSTKKPADGYTAPKSDRAEIEDAVQEAAIAPDATGVGKLRWPVHGRVVADFGSQNGGKRNDGVDIAVPEGTPVKAAENGVVIYAGDGLKDFGNTVLIRHENGLVTVYGHNGNIGVSRGATVKRGQEIARSGLSGNAGSPKLHFEVRKDSTPVNPAKYLE